MLMFQIVCFMDDHSVANGHLDIGVVFNPPFKLWSVIQITIELQTSRWLPDCQYSWDPNNGQANNGIIQVADY